MFKRIAVVNRGEAAMRLINAVREVNAEGGSAELAQLIARGPIETVALFTDGERTATFVREADLTYPLGPASARAAVRSSAGQLSTGTVWRPPRAAAMQPPSR